MFSAGAGFVFEANFEGNNRPGIDVLPSNMVYYRTLDFLGELQGECPVPPVAPDGKGHNVVLLLKPQKWEEPALKAAMAMAWHHHDSYDWMGVTVCSSSKLWKCLDLRCC